ncbi:MAG: hypothetical protein Tp185DCM00d2C31949991_28 [Prokaryotic dsDNA virus sp.]|nr:MAG: hypothetical protein Tp162SUR1511541_4 [Prokaryotic dsDNA virus sp.]QDP56740.1 MAG: hypothetical protein Tp185DCM00d2C31949991_28 [Prokaryotic dsDNA virus sp.]QDP63811.1 MAG: hypothetical protein Unbinned2480contig1002_65 [Prokaryotic dsDNA virus sp.]QDP63844.1 MAG: hypothetical protein GOVbin2429_28 [Prokaryotic dsDNA virus sp.]
MLTLYLLMAVDWYANTYNTESFLSKAYPYIVSVIHVAICLSLYNTTKIYNSITNHVYGFMFAFRYFRLVSYFWYTSRYR